MNIDYIIYSIMNNNLQTNLRNESMHESGFDKNLCTENRPYMVGRQLRESNTNI